MSYTKIEMRTTILGERGVNDLLISVVLHAIKSVLFFLMSLYSVDLTKMKLKI